MGLKPDAERSMKVAALLIRWRDRLDEGPITETDFWQRLEFRLCREMAGNREWAALGLWCDGIRPDTIGLNSTPQIIEGKAWVGIGPKHQEEWSFGMVLPTRVEHRSQIDWDALLPPDDVTGWMSVDRERRRLELEPGLAIRDEA